MYMITKNLVFYSDRSPFIKGC